MHVKWPFCLYVFYYYFPFYAFPTLPLSVFVFLFCPHPHKLTPRLPPSHSHLPHSITQTHQNPFHSLFLSFSTYNPLYIFVLLHCLTFACSHCLLPFSFLGVSLEPSTSRIAAVSLPPLAVHSSTHHRKCSSPSPYSSLLHSSIGFLRTWRTIFPFLFQFVVSSQWGLFDFASPSSF